MGLSPLALAEVPFHCHTLPGQTVQAYEYGSSNCGGIDSGETGRDLGVDGEKSILCSYQAACQPVSDEIANREPDLLTAYEINAAFIAGALKPSIVTCRGTGNIVKGRLLAANCPTPTQCKRDIFYNFAVVNVNPMAPLPMTVPRSEGRTRVSP